ncbi:substrate-binding periplasmic protein [Psychromonas aquimarina]|uniref:substrate-binding periplasmic protein n=1 Tax=Psychromonas aquimarina TaxID=444919 RepID=UPI00040C7275|nr:transporter substrate-binding domain-containing protein [Psychromonas aquimarina]
MKIAKLLAFNIIFFQAPFVMSDEKLNLVTALEPPQQYLEDGRLQGIGIDVINAIQKEVGSSYKISYFPWARAMRDAKTTKNTVMFLAAKSPDREPYFNFIGPILSKKYYLYKRSNSSLEIQSLEAARNVKSITSMRSDVRTSYLISRGFNNIQVLVTHKQGLLMLIKGRADLWTNSDWELPSQLKAANIQSSQLTPVYELFKKFNYIIVNNQTDPNIISNWKKALRKIKDDGTMEIIAAKWSEKLNMNLHFNTKSDAIEIKLE